MGLFCLHGIDLVLTNNSMCSSDKSKELSCSLMLELQMLASPLPLALTWPQGEFGSETSSLSFGSPTSLEAVSTGGVPVSCACETPEHLRCFRLVNTSNQMPPAPPEPQPRLGFAILKPFPQAQGDAATELGAGKAPGQGRGWSRIHPWVQTGAAGSGAVGKAADGSRGDLPSSSGQDRVLGTELNRTLWTGLQIEAAQGS